MTTRQLRYRVCKQSRGCTKKRKKISRPEFRRVPRVGYMLSWLWPWPSSFPRSFASGRIHRHGQPVSPCGRLPSAPTCIRQALARAERILDRSSQLHSFCKRDRKPQYRGDNIKIARWVEINHSCPVLLSPVPMLRSGSQGGRVGFRCPLCTAQICPGSEVVRSCLSTGYFSKILFRPMIRPGFLNS